MWFFRSFLMPLFQRRLTPRRPASTLPLRAGVLALSLGLAAGPALLSGCAGPAAGGGPVEIRYWTGWTGKELDAQKELAAEFERSHPNIRVRVLSVAGAYNKMRIAFAGAATPDVASCVWADELAGYAMRGVLTPLDDLMQRSGRSGDEFVPGVWDMLQYKGRPYALAVTTNTSFIVYNKQLFREAGLDPEWHPKTIAELDHAAEATTIKGPNGSLVRYGLRPVELMRWAYVFGGHWYDPATGDVTANDPRNVEALRWMASYGKKYDVTRMQNFEASFGGVFTANGPFFVGKTAMWQAGEWALTHIRRHAPDLDWGFFPMPTPPGGRPNTSTVSGSVFVIPKATRHPEEAWAFLNWLTQPYAVSRFCQRINNLPPLRALSEAPEFRKEPIFSFALELAAGKNVFGPPQMPIWPRYKSEIMRAEEYAIMGGQDPQRLLDEIDARMEKELARTLREAE
jgi:multiple sugar transport system substrate-binding protein